MLEVPHRIYRKRVFEIKPSINSVNIAKKTEYVKRDWVVVLGKKSFRGRIRIRISKYKGSSRGGDNEKEEIFKNNGPMMFQYWWKTRQKKYKQSWAGPP